jgi:hypothetical protein
MPFLKWTIKDQYDYGKMNRNDTFFIEPVSTTIEWYINELFKNKIEVDIVSVLRGYCYWREDSDMFFLFKDHILDLLRSRKCVLMIDNSLEGHSELEFPIIQSLYYNCEKYNIDPDLIFLITGNLRSETISSFYAASKKIRKEINVIGINGCEAQVIQPGQNKTLFENIVKSRQSKSEKIMLSLSRRNREFRVLTQYLLTYSNIVDKIIYSQDQTSENFLKSRRQIDLDSEINYDKSSEWLLKLPIRADESNFMHNYAADLNTELYNQTIFSLVLETEQEASGDTALFYSEKPFKAILNYQPLIIYGQPGMNFGLREFGYKTYEDYFRLEMFDFEVNPVKRLIKIVEEVERVINYLSSLSRNEQLDWRFKNISLFEYNVNVYQKKEYFKNKLTQTILTMRSVINGGSKYYWKKY